MDAEETKLAQYINELSTNYVKFTKLGEDISQANNQTSYIIDSFAYSVINRIIQLTQGYITLVNTNITFALSRLSGYSWIMPCAFLPYSK